MGFSERCAKSIIDKSGGHLRFTTSNNLSLANGVNESKSLIEDAWIFTF